MFGDFTILHFHQLANIPARLRRRTSGAEREVCAFVFLGQSEGIGVQHRGIVEVSLHGDRDGRRRIVDWIGVRILEHIVAIVVAEIFKALGDPTRLTILASLWKAKAPICICDFTAGLGLTQPTISHHMAKLKAAGLVESDKRGIWIYYRLQSTLSPATRRLLGQLIG